jgi:CMP/dCMP kinase
MILTIDGPAGSGKSTAARLLAQRLGFQFLDTGAMYRAVALECLERQIDLADETRVAEVARVLKIDALGPTVLSNGRDVTAAIRAPEIAGAASRVAAIGAVREAMVRLQRQAAAGHNIVTEGRDQGTVVFPDALCKFYLTADPDERARRRQREMQEQGVRVAFDELRSQIAERDARDQNRRTSPLQAASDALSIDTTNMTIDETARCLETIVRRRMASRSESTPSA